MRTLHRTALFLALGTLCLGMGTSLRAAPTGTPIFDNSVNDLVHRWSPTLSSPTSTLEVGNEILLAGTERYLTFFDFEYWATTANHVSFAGAVEARVRFYVNDGSPPFNGYATPGYNFFDSGWFGGFLPTDGDPNRATISFSEGPDFSAGGLFIPTSDMTWTIQFQGLGTGDTVGLDLYSPAVVGMDYEDFWQYNGGWTLQTNSYPTDFAARFYANETVPEPSAVTLSILGGLGILTLARRLRCKE
jgi:hypothetical protein